MAHNSMAAMGDMAKNFVTGAGGFDPTTKQYHYDQNPAPNGSSFAFDAKTMNTQAALTGALAFGGGVLPQGMGMMAGILPAALKIEEHKKMRAIAEKYYEKYIKDFNKKYGFTEAQIQALVKEFDEVTSEICSLIPDQGMQDMYRKYIASYPTMYLSMIPAEALQTKLAVKCVTENGVLRRKIEEMSGCVSKLVKNLTDLQISAGIPPIVNLMFESMPDPLTAITDPMYHKYNDAIMTYHRLLDDTAASTIPRIDTAQPVLSGADHLRTEPVHYLKELSSSTTPPSGLSQDKIKDLYTVMSNMHTQSGCQPFGDEWNHTGPTPAMNPAMCLSETDRFQPGNPRHNVGRTNLYQAKRDQNGNAHWVQTGEIPALSGGGPQMVQHQPQPLQNANQWAGVRHMPGVDPRPNQHMSMPMPPVQPMQQMQGQQLTGPSQEQFDQPYAAPKARRSSKARTPKKKNSKSRTRAQ